MITKKQIKHISSLKQAKFRNEFNEFTVEGDKMVKELIQSTYKVISVYALKEWIEINQNIIESNKTEIQEISLKALERISSLKTPNQALALVKKQTESYNKDIFGDLVLVLDKIQDPGNLGTIIRTADWFGIKNIICSEDTADIFNPKVIQSSMGSFLRVHLYYKNLQNFFKTEFPTDLNIYGAFLEGENIYKITLSSKGIIVIGNESKGISDEISGFIKKRISIPSFNTSSNKTESLNASIATAILLNEFKRR